MEKRNKKIILSCAAIISLAIIFIYIYNKNFCTKCRNVEVDNTRDLMLHVIEPENCSGEIDLTSTDAYYNLTGSKIYFYCLVDILVNKSNNDSDKAISLKEALDNTGTGYIGNGLIATTTDEIINNLEKIDSLLDGGTTIYRDTKSKKIAGGNLTVIKCNTIDGNKDIYIGSQNMEYKSNFCKANNKTFTKTYTIKNIEKYTEQQYEDGAPVSYGNSFKVTLSQFQTETKTIIINNLWNDLKENQTYEFEFMSNDGVSDITDNIESIFKNSIIVEIRKTNKTGLDQIQDSIN